LFWPHAAKARRKKKEEERKVADFPTSAWAAAIYNSIRKVLRLNTLACQA
jgi:hypothetical protein